MLPVASADEIKIGDAEILSNVDGDSVQRYSVQIVKLYPANDEYGRSMMLRVTDSQLAEKTGGIVQGMSGSPILQNGKLIGAVTHVLVDNPMEGYGISMEKNAGGKLKLRIENGEWKMPLSLREFCSRCGRNGFVLAFGRPLAALFLSFRNASLPYLIDFVVENAVLLCILSISGEF